LIDDRNIPKLNFLQCSLAADSTSAFSEMTYRLVNVPTDPFEAPFETCKFHIAVSMGDVPKWWNHTSG